MTIRKRLASISIKVLLIFILLQVVLFAYAIFSTNGVIKKTNDSLTTQAQNDVNTDITVLANVVGTFINEMENSIDDSMYHSALVLQKLDTQKELTQADLVKLLEELRVDDLYLADLDGKFTQSTVPGAVGGIGLFDIWEGYRMLVTGEATELPSTMKAMVETGKIYKFTAIPRYDEEGKIKGIIETALEVSDIESKLSNMLANYTQINSLHVFTTDGLCLASVEGSNATTHFKKSETANLEALNALTGKPDGTQIINQTDDSIVLFENIDRSSMGAAAYVLRLDLDADYYTAHSKSLSLSLDSLSKYFGGLLVACIITGVVGVLVTAFTYISLVKKSILQPVYALRQITLNVAQGQLLKPDVGKNNDEITQLQKDLFDMIAAIEEQSKTLEIIAEGDYKVSIPLRSDGDVMNQSINKLAQMSAKALSDVRNAAGEVSNCANRTYDASTQIAASANSQSDSLRGISDTVEGVRDMSKESNQTATVALNNTTESARLLENCTKNMEQLLEAMQSISEKSQDISKVIQTIEGIASKTNLLSLNAAIEAAAAGTAGKGFAVVAEEVRDLAAKSAQAAKETTVLINSSVQSVEAGRKIVDIVNESINAANDIAGKNAECINDLYTNAEKQSSVMGEIVGEIKSLTQTVEDSARSASEASDIAVAMTSEAESLNLIVQKFKL